MEEIKNGLYLVNIENGNVKVFKMPDKENFTVFEENIELRKALEKAENAIAILKDDLKVESEYVDELKSRCGILSNKIED